MSGVARLEMVFTTRCNGNAMALEQTVKGPDGGKREIQQGPGFFLTHVEFLFVSRTVYGALFLSLPSGQQLAHRQTTNGR